MKHQNKLKSNWHKLGALLLFIFAAKFSFAQTTISVTATGGATSPITFCKGTEVMLIADANCPLGNDFTYSWSGGPYTPIVGPYNLNSHILIQPVANTVYSVTATPNMSISGQPLICPSVSTTFTVNYDANEPIITQSPDPTCANFGTVELTLSNLPVPTIPYNYNWNFTAGTNTITVSTTNPSGVLSPGNFPTSVVFTTSDPNACIGSMPVTINYPQPCSSGTTYTSSVLGNQNGSTISIINDVDVVGNVIINNSNISISPTKKITVKPGASLTISRSWLHGCVCPWQGIVLEGDAKLTIARASIIEDAMQAVSMNVSSSLPELTITRSIINKCDNGVYLNTSPTINMNGNIKINDVIFTCRNLNSSSIYGNMPAFNSLYSDYELTMNNTFGINTLQLTNNIDAVATKTVTLSGSRTQTGIKFVGHRSGTISPFPYGSKCMFDNMDYGIYAEVSSINITNTHFMNMEGNNLKKPLGIAIYSTDFKYEDVNSECLVSYCSINNVCRGIHTEGVVVTKLHNTIISSDLTYTGYNVNLLLPGQYGIFYLYSPGNIAAATAGAYWEIENNTIRNYDMGVSVIRNVSLSNVQLTGTNNKFSCNTIFGQNGNNHYCRIGFYMNDGVGTNGGSPGSTPETGGDVGFKGNDILRCTQSAIWLENVSQHFYIRNSVSSFLGNSINGAYLTTSYGPAGFTLRNNGIKSYTILLNSCNNINIDNTNIWGYWGNLTGSQYLTTGIAMFNSRAFIFNNKISNNKNDISFNGNCMPSVIRANTFSKATNALYFENDAQIGNQGGIGSPAGNYFATSNLSWQTNVANGTSDPNATSKFSYKNAASGGFTQNMPNSMQTVVLGTPATFQYKNPIGLVQTTGNVTVFTEPNFCSGPAPVPPPGTDPFNLIAGASDSLNIIKGLILDSLPLQIFHNQKWWRNKVEAYKMIEKNPSYFLQDAVVNAFYNNNQNTSVGKLNQVYEYTASGQTQMAESVNNNLPVNDAIEDYNKAVNYIYLKNLNDSLYTLDSTDMSSLETIANSCPDEMGKVVYEARNMLMNIKKQVLEYNDSCSATSSTNRNLPIKYKSNNAFENYQSFVLFPNPNNGAFELKQKLGKNFNGAITVTDVLGKKVFENKITDQKSISIDLTKENNFSGIYFVKLVNENNQLLYLGKVIVQ